MEPIQGEAGAIVPPDDFWPRIRKACDEYGALLIADEVQTGLGRTGKLFGVDHWNVVPDIMCLGKAIGGGVMPLSAFISTPKIWSVLETNPFIHSSTFGGNPLACAAGIAAINVTLEEDLSGPGASARASTCSPSSSASRCATTGCIQRVGGRGLLLGIEFVNTEIGYKVVAGLFRRGVLVAGTLTNSKVVRIEPALNIPRQADRARSSARSRRRSRKSTTRRRTSRPTRTDPAMKIAILGAAGAMAQVVLRDLLEFVPDVEITAADLKPLAQAHGDPRVRPATLDAADEAATARLLEGHDAVLNCVTYYFNVPIMRAALAARVPYADLGGLYHGSIKQFALHEDFVARGRPGAARHGLDARHHERHGRRPRPRASTRSTPSTCASAASTAAPPVRCRFRTPSTRSSTSSRSSRWSSTTAGPPRCPR